MTKIECPSCKADGDKVIYMGIPVKLCMNENCNTVWGFWSFIMTWIPFNGYFTVYEGNYFVELFYWIFDNEK